MKHNDVYTVEQLFIFDHATNCLNIQLHIIAYTSCSLSPLYYSILNCQYSTEANRPS